MASERANQPMLQIDRLAERRLAAAGEEQQIDEQQPDDERPPGRQRVSNTLYAK